MTFDADSLRNRLKELLGGMPIVRAIHGEGQNVLADMLQTADADRTRTMSRINAARVGQPVEFTPDELQRGGDFWKPAGLMGSTLGR